MTPEELNTAIYHKMEAEQDSYRDWLLTLPPDEILPHAYEYAVRQDIRNLDKRIRQMEFLFRHSIDTLQQLDAYRQTQEQAVDALLTERRQLHKAAPNDAVKARLTQITQSLKPLRRDIWICRQIAEQSVQMQKRLRQREESRQNTERNPAHEPDRKTNPTR